MQPLAQQGPTRSTRSRRIAALAATAVLSLTPAAAAQEADPAPPAPDPDPAPTAAPAAVTPAAPVVEATVVPAVGEPVRRAAPARRERTATRPPRPAPVATVRGDTPWDRGASVAVAPDDTLTRAGLGLLALCVASAGLQLLSARLRRGALR